MPKSKTRYARAQARARYRKPKRRNSSMGWNVAIAAIVLVGALLIFFTVRSNKSEAGVHPLPANAATGELGDHWHAAFDVDICGDKLPTMPEFETVADNPGVRTGLHTHGDGVIHIHPFYSSEAGNNATLGKFFDGAGDPVSETEIHAWTAPTSNPDKTDWKNGDTCTIDGKNVKGVVRWSVNGKERTGNPADYKLKNQDQILIFFGPKNAKLPKVESRTPEQDSADPSKTIGSTPSTSAPTTTVPATSTPPSS